MRGLLFGAVILLTATSVVSAAEGSRTCAEAEARAAGCACAVEIPQSGPIAQLSDISGNVLVAGHAGFTPIHGPTGVNLGDQINVGAGGGAILSFGPHCKVTLSGPEQLKVKVSHHCACAAVIPFTPGAAGVGAAGAGTAGAVVGGLAVAGGIGGLIFTQTNNQSSP